MTPPLLAPTVDRWRPRGLLEPLNPLAAALADFEEVATAFDQLDQAEQRGAPRLVLEHYAGKVQRVTGRWPDHPALPRQLVAELRQGDCDRCGAFTSAALLPDEPLLCVNCRARRAGRAGRGGESVPVHGTHALVDPADDAPGRPSPAA